MPSESLLGLDTSAGDARDDASGQARPPAAWEVIAFIGMNLLWPTSPPTGLAGYRLDGVKRPLKDFRIVRVRRRNQGREGNALPVDDEVVLAAGFAAVDRIGAGESPHFCAGITDASRAARSKASRSSLFSAANIDCHIASQTPVACHATNRRQHVIPEP